VNTIHQGATPQTPSLFCLTPPPPIGDGAFVEEFSGLAKRWKRKIRNGNAMVISRGRVNLLLIQNPMVHLRITWRTGLTIALCIGFRSALGHTSTQNGSCGK